MLMISLAVILYWAANGFAEPMGTAFTYQGRLTDANLVADGFYDFQFRLYDSAIDGNQIGGNVIVSDLDVIDGYFSTELNFTDANAFNGDARWLEIGVRPGTLNDPNIYTLLTPRQRITATPYARYAASSQADGDWDVSGDNMYAIPQGNVGIGTEDPDAPLHIKANYSGIHVESTIGHAHVSIERAGGSWLSTLDFLTNGGINWSIGTGMSGDNDFSISNAGYGNVMFMIDNSNGNIGIGTETPAAQLTVAGGILKDGSTMHGTGTDTHINMGTTSTTGESGQNYSYATVGGGISNIASGQYSVVSGGNSNQAGHWYATISGGGHNTASSLYGTIGGGTSNIASGYTATVPGGFGNEATGDYSFAAGREAKANHNGTFVWADSTDANFASTANDQFLIRASGGVGIGTSSPTQQLEVEGTVKATSFVGDGSGLTGLSSDSDWTVNGNDMYSAVTGNIGIGTTSPSVPLHISNDNATIRVNSTTTNSSLLQLSRSNLEDGAVLAGDNLIIRESGTSAGDIIFNTSVNTERLRIKNTGEVGIGDSNPDGHLEVNPDGVEDNGDEFVVTAAGDVGIGNNTPYGKFEVDPDNIRNSGNEFVVTNQGNVGIGTTNPGSDLYVKGNANSGFAVCTVEAGGDNTSILANGGDTGIRAVGQQYAVSAFSSSNSFDNVAVFAEATSNAGSNDVTAVKGQVTRSGSGNFYSGYFHHYGSGGSYWGLYADYRSGDAIDLAEYIYDTGANTKAGDVLVADPDNDESVIKSSTPYDATVVGIVSTQPHLLMGTELIRDEETGKVYEDVNAAMLALAGRVPVKVTDENGPIKRGDMLTTSSKPGYAMKWTALDVTEAENFEQLKTMLAENQRRNHAIVGKALEPLPSGEGKIMILVNSR